MSKKGIIISSIISIVFLVVFGFCLSWTIINFDKVKSGMSGTELYTKEDLDTAHSDGYDEGIKDKNKYLEMIDEYRDNIINKTDEISVLNKTIKEKNDLIIQKDKLISENKVLIDSLNEELDKSNLVVSNKDNEIQLLNKENEKLKQEIIDLNDEILDYKNQIKDIEKTIDDLNKSIEYYKKFVTALETDFQAVATFVYDGSVYSILMVQKGSTVSIANPTDTEYLKFNGWSVNDEMVDLSTYKLNTNTTFVANLTYSYKVSFMVDDSEFDSKIIVKNGFASTPSDPFKSGYIFKGWSLNGVSLVDVTSVEITRDTVFVALFEKVHSVQFVLDEETISSQSIENNKFAETPSSTSEYIQVNYWTVDGEKVDVSTYPITKDTVFVANYTRKYDVKFMYEDTEFNNQIVLDGNIPTIVIPDNTDYKEFKGWSIDKETIVNVATTPITETTTYYAIIEYSFDVKFMIDSTLYENQIVKANSCPTLPTNPNLVGYEFDGWSIDGKTIIDITSIQITNTTEFEAVFTQLFTVKFNYENTIVDSQIIRNGGYASNYVVEDTNRVKFQGWSLDGSNIIDVTSIEVNQDIVFVAVVKHCYEVKFIANDVIMDTKFVEDGNCASYTEALEIGDYKISGWTYNNSSVTLSSYQITSDITFIASVKRYKITASGNRSTAYSINDNSSSAGVVIYNFKLSELKTDFTDVNSSTIEVVFDGTTFKVDSSYGNVGFFYGEKLGVSCNPTNGGWSLYIYDLSLLWINVTVTIYPYKYDISSRL